MQFSQIEVNSCKKQIETLQILFEIRKSNRRFSSGGVVRMVLENGAGPQHMLPLV